MWPSQFQEGVEVVPVQLPGRESRGLEQPFSSVHALVRDLAPLMRPLLDVPFSFFGHSMGALIAFELARELISQYSRSPEHLFVSAKSAPQLPHRDGKQLHDLPDQDFKEELRMLNGTPEEILGNEDLMRLLMPRLRADIALCETYEFRDRGYLACPITAFGGHGDSGVSRDSLEAWGALTSESMSLRMVDGNHFFLHSQESAIISAVRQELKKTEEYIRAHALVLK